MRKIKLISVFLILFFVSTQYGFTYNLKQISNRDGLSNSAILSMCQDKEGFMWFGSCDGLNLFNGIDIQVYKPSKDSINLSGNLIENIIETENGILWIHTNYGLNRLDKRKKTIEAYNQFKGRYLIQKDEKNRIFIINEDNRIYYYHPESLSFKAISIENLIYENILNFMVSSDGILHIYAKNGENPSYVIEENENGEISLSQNRLFQHDYNLLYCFYERDIKDIVYLIDETYTLYEYRVTDRRKQYVQNIRDEIGRYGEISSMIKHHNDFFIGFKTNGLLRLKNTPDKIENYVTEHVDVNIGIFCLLKDKFQDLIWIGTDGQGVYMYSNDPYSIKSSLFSTFAGNIEKPVRALFIDHEKTLWIGTKGDGIVKIGQYDPDKVPTPSSISSTNTGNSSLYNNSVYAFEPGSKNILWIGTEDGLNYYSYRDRMIRNINLTVDGEPVKYIHSICEVGDSVLWLATVGTGIVKARITGFDGSPTLSNVERITIQEGKDSYNYFFTTYKENNSTIWFGNRGYGAYKIGTDNVLQPVNLDKNQINQTLNDVFSIVKDSKSNMWFGTSFGLVKYPANGEIEVFNEKDGFLNNTVHSILPDSYGNLWLSTNRGIIRFDTKEKNFQTFTELNGLQVTEFSDGAAFKDMTNNTLYFGGINGFVTITETGVKRQDYLPPIYFGNLTIFGEEENIYNYLEGKENGEKLELKHYQNFFSVSFTALDYINGNNYTYYYKLDELSDQWIDNGTSNNASFTSLAPGTYTLSTKYKNRLTGKESPVYLLSIRILPPWYLSVWAYMIYYILALAMIALIIRAIYMRNEKKKELALEKLNQQHQEEVYESKLRFFTNIAHEFCTPLTLIYGPCNRILKHHGSDKFVKRYTYLIQRNAERLNDLIQDLIEFRRIETGNRIPVIQQVSISEIVDDIAGSFNEMAESENVHFGKDIQPELKWNTDKNFLYTITTNLLSNAFNSVPSKGNVKIEMLEKHGKLFITVSNTGKGIKEENIGDIFNRYSILDNFENQDGDNSSRNGFGLAISNSMVKLLDGTIDISSIPDEWTSFTVILPEKEITEISDEEQEQLLPEVEEKKKESEPLIELPEYSFNKFRQTVMVVDSDIETLWLISEIFANDYNVIPAKTPNSAAKILMETHPDIIICDVMIPETDGISFIKKIKSDKKTAHIPLILISAKYTVEEQIEGLASGAEMYITKPFNVDYLRTSVKHLISRKETLKNYFSSPLSAFELNEGKLIHKENTKFVQDIYNIIEKNITNKKLSAQFIAAELNISPRHLYRRISEIKCESPADMIKESRLHIARNLLLNTKMTIDEIIYKSGFFNRATFFRAFAQRYNCTPKEYREKEMQNLD
jgi:signal transduction histidine kinase/ligand-binding sensor domain-containing protein/DNA-binding response OmpR family regulator